MQVLRAHFRPPNRTSGDRAGQSVLRSSKSSGTHSSLRSTALGKLLVSARKVSYAIGEVFFSLEIKTPFLQTQAYFPNLNM